MRIRKHTSKWKEAQTSRLPCMRFLLILFSNYISLTSSDVFSQLPWKRWYSEQIWAQMTLLRTWFVFRTFFCSPKELYSEPQHLNWGGCPDLWSSSHSSNCTCLFLSWIFFYPQMGMALHGPNFHQTRYYRFHEFEHTLEKKKSVPFRPSAFPVIEKHQEKKTNKSKVSTDSTGCYYRPPLLQHDTDSVERVTSAFIRHQSPIHLKR